MKSVCWFFFVFLAGCIHSKASFRPAFQEFGMSNLITSKALHSRPIIVAGVIDKAHESDNNSREIAPPCTECKVIIEETLQEVRPDLRLIKGLSWQGNTSVAQSGIRKILDDFAPHEEMSDEGYDLMSKLGPTDPWFIIAVLEGNTTSREKEVEVKNKITSTQLTAKRLVRMRFFVYDALNRELAWTGVKSEVLSYTNRYTDDHRKANTLVEMLIDIALQPSQTYPEYPSRKSLVSKLSNTFVDSLPR